MIRFGILGCARISRRGLIPGIQNSQKAKLTAIASRDRSTAQQWAAEFSIPRAHGSYEELLADPTVDAVYIPLPNEMHLPYVDAAAKAGKHILCEKPLALNEEEAQRMVEVASNFGVQLMEAFMWRHHPRVTKARELLAAGRIGELRLVKMDFSFQLNPSDWRADPKRGGGALFDLGCYGINAARLFSGMEPIESRGWTVFSKSGVDMTSGIQIRFPNNVQALIDCSFECPDRNRIEIVGTGGSIELRNGVLPQEGDGLILTTSTGSETIFVQHADQYAEQVNAFCTAIQTGKLPSPAENGLANMRALEMVQGSLAGTE
ncbi:MAG: Gfo/Idh/MocA family oxidoreductase [Planctomycetota bacterium]|nr:Gfo/Idh/MocA family oxidoreductase [Planctomycetota bacterium]